MNLVDAERIGAYKALSQHMKKYKGTYIDGGIVAMYNKAFKPFIDAGQLPPASVTYADFGVTQGDLTALHVREALEDPRWKPAGR